MNIGARIKTLRKAKGYSQRSLAETIRVSAMAISKYENDADIPSSQVLHRLAPALGVPVDAFFRQANVQIQAVHYRMHPLLGKKEQGRILSTIQEWLERYQEVEELSSSIQQKFELRKKNTISNPDDIEEAAESIRRILKIGEDSIENITSLLEDNGVKVGQIEADKSFDACTFLNDDQPVIAVQKNIPGDRQRFSLCHELGHLVLEFTDNYRGEQELAINRFAGAFLVPASKVTFELGEKREQLSIEELGILKNKYGLSMQGWIHRAEDLKIITMSCAKKMRNEFSVKEWRKKEPGEQYPTETPERMTRLVYRALEERHITHSRAKELLGSSVKEIP